MNRLFFTFTILVLFLFAVAGFVFAQQSTSPPLLTQPVQNPVVQPTVVGPQPGPQVAPPPPPQPGPPPPAPAPLNPMETQIMQSVPIQTLFTDLSRAISTIQQLDKMLTPGKVWIVQGPAGETDIKSALLYQGAAIAVLHFSPDGKILPIGIVNHTYQNSIDIQGIKNNLPSLIRNLKILPVAEFLEPERCWVFPVVDNNIIVSKLKVYYDGIHVVQDYIASQEMAYLGR